MKKVDVSDMSVRQEVTIYDIASQLGVASSTVSRGLQNHPTINKKTRQKIADTAAALGYQRNVFAGSLRNHATRTIGVLVHDLNGQFISSVLSGIGTVAADAGYDVVIAYSAESSVKEMANARNFFNRRVDGVIASLTADTTDMSHFTPFRNKKVPVIFFDRAEEYPDSTMVVIDNARCGYQATSHLLQQGSRRIALVTGSLNRDVYAQRYKGYAQALQEHGIAIDDSLVLVNSLDEAGGIEAAKAIMGMAHRPDGAFISSDFTAAVCMRELMAAGWSIPGDLAIVGFNDDLISRIVTPQLTTVQYPGIEIGEIAARSLINHLTGHGDISGAARIVVRSQLIERASSQRLGTVVK